MFFGALSCRSSCFRSARKLSGFTTTDGTSDRSCMLRVSWIPEGLKVVGRAWKVRVRWDYARRRRYKGASPPRKQGGPLDNERGTFEVKGSSGVYAFDGRKVFVRFAPFGLPSGSSSGLTRGLPWF